MYRQESREEYTRALRMGQKEYKERIMAGKDPYPAVLDEILGELPKEGIQAIPLVEIPAEQIVGTKSQGRISAFTAGFQPLLEPDSEFATKWINLCAAHLSDEGIRDPISCFEYLGNFYVQEGNKRVSVLRHFGAARIPGTVQRILPPMSEEPRIKAYYEFLDFYKAAEIMPSCWLSWARIRGRNGRTGRKRPLPPISSISGRRSMPWAERRWRSGRRTRCCSGCRCILSGIWGGFPAES